MSLLQNTMNSALQEWGKKPACSSGLKQHHNHLPCLKDIQVVSMLKAFRYLSPKIIEHLAVVMVPKLSTQAVPHPIKQEF